MPTRNMAPKAVEWQEMPADEVKAIIREHFERIGADLREIELWLQRSSENSINPRKQTKLVT